MRSIKYGMSGKGVKKNIKIFPKNIFLPAADVSLFQDLTVIKTNRFHMQKDEVKQIYFNLKKGTQMKMPNNEGGHLPGIM